MLMSIINRHGLAAKSQNDGTRIIAFDVTVATDFLRCARKDCELESYIGRGEAIPIGKIAKR